MLRMKGIVLVALAALVLPSIASAQSKYLDNNSDPRFPITSPVSTYWDELYPTRGNTYHLSSWQDNGDGYLSPSDIIDLSNSAGIVSYWHVDLVTITIFLTEKVIGGNGIADWHVNSPNLSQTMYNPVSTYWDWIPPGTGSFHLSSWQDNGDGYLSPSDQIDITDLATGHVTYWHVDRVATDIVISPEPGSMAAVGTGLAALLAICRRKKRA